MYWTKFENLTGSAQHNFEALCRSLVRLRWGRFGELAGLANQPGVEFHLRLHADCDLGESGRWFGWQCRWYDLPGGRALGTTRRDKIEKALAKTAAELPELTDWILCTRHPLTKSDQKWYNGLKKANRLKMRLSMWSGEDIDTFMVGEAAILRQTFFGDLVFTPDNLKKQHAISVARIRKRWLPEAHQSVGAERIVRRMLVDAESWDELATISASLRSNLASLPLASLESHEKLKAFLPEFLSVANGLLNSIQSVLSFIRSGDLDLLRRKLDTRIRTVSRAVRATPRVIRSANLACGMPATNALADIKQGLRLLDEVNDFLGARFVGIIADAGGGKTQLSATLTAPQSDRPAGIILYGMDLHSGRTLDHLVQGISVDGKPLNSMISLLSALDAAGQRAKRKLPLIIDGLNESENPMDWNAPLSELDITLKDFAHVLLICTVRSGSRRSSEHVWDLRQLNPEPARIDFAKQAIPEGIQQISLDGFGGDTSDAIWKYFDYFRINPGDADLPIDLLRHPLTLRIFCEVANPTRKEEVGIEAMPGSLTALFDLYLDQSIDRIAELSPRRHPFFAHDVRAALDVFGTMLWESRNREISEREFRKEVGDDARPWNESMLHMLEQEGVILITPGDTPGRKNVIAVYDALGGHLIADAILSSHGRNGLEPWLRDPATLEAIDGRSSHCHPLAQDTFSALVGLVPRKHHRQQLWQLLDEPLKSTALRMACRLEAAYLDTGTVDAIGESIRAMRPESERIFVRLLNTRSSSKHPLNADFFDAVLRSMPVADRDLHWTEWVRSNRGRQWDHRQELNLVEEVSELEEIWRSKLETRSDADRLRAKWIMWLLTTSILNLRDRVTRCLYWFGRGDAAALFRLAEDASNINDPYIFERMLAACYGVSMAECGEQNRTAFCKEVLSLHARRVYEIVFSEQSPQRTTHTLIREYARGIIELAILHCRNLFSTTEIAQVRNPGPNANQWLADSKAEDEAHGIDSPFGMDFENYTLGRLAKDRGNYDYHHPGYRKICGQILTRVRELGWDKDRFKEVDQRIGSERNFSSPESEEHNKVDRYAKKYSWIAYFELGGWLKDRGLGKARSDSGRPWDIDLDPSFPDPPISHRIVKDDLMGNTSLSFGNWIKFGPGVDLQSYAKQASINGDKGPWIALDGIVARQDRNRERRIVAFFRSFLVAKPKKAFFLSALSKESFEGRWLPEKPSSTRAFSGEIPWCHTFPKTEDCEFQFKIGEERRTVRRRQEILVLDGKSLGIAPSDLIPYQIFGDIRKHPTLSGLSEEEIDRIEIRQKLVEVDELHEKFQEFRAAMPVCDFEWHGRTVEGVPIGGVTLSKRFAKAARLRNQPQTIDLRCPRGQRATYGTQHQPGSFYDSEKFLFVREDILKEVLRKEKLALVFAIWGTREILRTDRRPKRELEGPHESLFQEVWAY